METDGVFPGHRGTHQVFRSAGVVVVWHLRIKTPTVQARTSEGRGKHPNHKGETMELQALKLEKLHVSNFKGCQKFSLDTQGGNVSIYGANRTGKTTIMDAYQWLLFGKDSLDQAAFELKPIGQDNRGVEVCVEAHFGGFSLKKVLTEKWTKKRGQAASEFSGHQIDHWIDGVPTKKGEFDARVEAIADKQKFTLLSNPRHFSESMHWQKRRELLLSICGDVTDAEVIATSKTLERIPDVIGKRSIEDQKKVLTARRTEINRELEKIPTRLDELSRGMDREFAGLSGDKIKAGINELQEALKKKQTDLAELKSGASLTSARELWELERKTQAVMAEHHQEQVRKKLATKEAQGLCSAELTRLSRLRANTTTIIAETVKNIEELRAQWHTINASTYTDSECPTCGQALPADRLQECIARHNETKAGKLKQISEQGKQQREILGQVRNDLDGLTKIIQEKKAELERLTGDLTKLDATAEPDISDLVSRRLGLEEALEKEKAGAPDTSALEAEITTIEARIQECRVKLARIEATALAIKRMADLKTEERSLAKELEEIEKDIYLLEQFVRAKVSLLEGRINSRFKMIEFRLFDQQINGGITECCDMTVNGVPYHSLNNEARINGGIEVCNVLAAHEGKSLPMWVDNAEAVNSLLPAIGQQIRLVVSDDKQLRIERNAA